MVLGAVIIFINLGLNLSLPKSVGDVQGLQRCDVALQQVSTVASTGKHPGRLNAEPLADNWPQEIFISCDVDKVESMYSPGIDAIDDTKHVGTSFFVKLDVGVEVTAALEIVQQIAPALVQEIIVEGIFFVDWDLSFQHASAHMKTLGVDDDDWSGLDQVGVVDGIGYRVMFLFRDRNLSKHAMLLLKFLAQALKGVGNASRRDAIARMHFCNIFQLPLGEGRVAGGLDLAHMGRLSRSDVKNKVDLLDGCVGSAFRGDARPIIPILLHELADVLESAIKFVGSMKFAELVF